MRLSNKDLKTIGELANRALGGSGVLTETDLRFAILHCRWLATIDNDRAESWGRLYRGKFKKVGIAFPPVGSDVRAVTSGQNAAKAKIAGTIGRPSKRPLYCARPLVVECARCPLRMGRYWDCTGRPVNGSFGSSVVVDGVEVRAARRKDGKRLRGSFFAGGYVCWGAVGWFKKPKGYSAEEYIDCLAPLDVAAADLKEVK